MSIKTETEYNLSEKTGSIRFYSGNNLVTEYSCDSDGYISMSNRTVSHENNMTEYHSGLKETLRWLREIKKMHSLESKEDKSTFKMDINIDEVGVTYSYRTVLIFNNRKRERIISKMKFTNDTQNVTFYSRPAVRLKLVDFEQAVNYTFYLLRLITQLT